MTTLGMYKQAMGERQVARLQGQNTAGRAWSVGLLRIIHGSVFLAGCAVHTPEHKETYGAQIGIVNHTDRYIYSASVGEGGGGSSFPFHAGIANICCVSLPRVWHPELQFLVRWDVPAGREHKVKEKVVMVERYDETGSLYVHFFPNDEIRIVVTSWYGGSENHPIPSPPQDPYRAFK